MLAIRLSLTGKKGQHQFRIIVSEKSKDVHGDYLELLGHYDPHKNQVNLKADRIKYWISKGAEVSGTVHNLLIDQKIIVGQKVKVANIRRKKESVSPKEEVKKAGEEKAEEKKEKPEKEEKPKEKSEAKSGTKEEKQVTAEKH